MSLPKNRKDNYSENAISKRVDFLHKWSGFRAVHLPQSNIDPKLTIGNIENLIGFTQVPVGVIGPLKINGDNADGEFFIPLSTTEGALISSFNRGARVITLSGGANVAVINDSIQRAPLFELENLFEARKFVNWVENKFVWLQQIAQSTTNNGKLLNYNAFIQGKVVYLRLNFSTGDAMGMNMVTKATYEVCKYIENHFPIVSYSLESNMAVDKKPAYINSILGRGKSVSAEVLIKKTILEKYFHTTAKQIERTYHHQVTGSIRAGTLGMNAHYANGMAALFLACGQDLGNISESCVGYTSLEAIDGDLYVSVNLPSLVIGTVGGGVSLPTQRECLELIDCYGTGKSKKFAEIVAATTLAGEISLEASIVAGDFVSAHEKYGRNKPQQDIPQIRN